MNGSATSKFASEFVVNALWSSFQSRACLAFALFDVTDKGSVALSAEVVCRLLALRVISLRRKICRLLD